MKKRFLALAMSLLMMASVLAGCGSQGASGTAGETQQSEASAEGAAASEEAAGEDAEESADAQAVSNQELVELRLIFYGDMSSRREEFFKNEFHDAVLEDLNIDLTVEFLPWGSDTNISTMLASGERFAVEYIVSNYDWHTKGYLAEIDESLLETHLPDLIAMRGENNGFECVKYEGKIYAVPFGNKPYSGSMQYFDVRGDILDELGYAPEDITTLEQLEEVFAACKESHPEMRTVMNLDFLPYALWAYCGEGTRSLNEGNDFVYVNEEEEGDKVYSYFESEAFKNLCEITSRWAEAGYIDKDLITNPSQSDADWNAANCLARNGMPGSLISSTLKTADPDAYETMVKIGDQEKIKNKDYDWGIAISAADQENVARWLDLFNWMNKDQEHFNFCVYGVEGKDYEVNEDGTITKLVSDSFIDSWFMEAIPYNTYDPSFDQETINKYEHWDDDAVFSKLTGFSFDTTPVTTEIAMLTSIYDEKLKPMMWGLMDYEENIDGVIEEMKAAGLDTYVAEYQRQFSEFYAQQNQ
ncbi:MAG TPA: ABC transporter substrate-binding protein [Candidatus Eisenbergiella merdavium]|uniref:ABC transporter substrate-binding protein n=2 Tax=Eisenbergiella TaxID=1432051 RepID=A0A9D2SES2_9FIRM|nr:ABC transporter substrate-binding protein [Candidatus Eisenbergiella merdigallinarum]HJC22276.1 ABC transporter substrate-binding protein [Candidatus Eisenbergiella merdavium]